MQRPPSFGKFAGLQRRSASANSSGSDLRSAESALESITRILDPSPSAADRQGSDEIAEVLRMLESMGDVASVKALASAVTLSNKALAETLVRAGEAGRVAFSKDADGTTFVQRIASP